MRDKAEKNARKVKYKDGLVDTSKPSNVRALEAVGLQSAEFVRLSEAPTSFQSPMSARFDNT